MLGVLFGDTLKENKCNLKNNLGYRAGLRPSGSTTVHVLNKLVNT